VAKNRCCYWHLHACNDSTIYNMLVWLSESNPGWNEMKNKCLGFIPLLHWTTIKTLSHLKVMGGRFSQTTRDNNRNLFHAWCGFSYTDHIKITVVLVQWSLLINLVEFVLCGPLSRYLSPLKTAFTLILAYWDNTGAIYISELILTWRIVIRIQ